MYVCGPVGEGKTNPFRNYEVTTESTEMAQRVMKHLNPLQIDQVVHRLQYCNH
jgi:hypothetical protein